MPYSKPKKRKCRKADGSSGSWVVDKELPSGKTEQSSCHDSEDKASASIRARKANEADVPYGEEINEDTARILVKEILFESKASDAFESDVARSIDVMGDNITASRPTVGTQYSDVHVSVDGVGSSWVEVKMNSTDNLSNPRVFYDGSSWGTTYKTPTAKYAIDLLNSSQDAAKFVSEIALFSGITNPSLPTTKGGLSDSNAVPLDIMRDFAESRGSRYIATEKNIDIGALVTRHYTEGKAEPADYMQSGDSFYLIGAGDPLGLVSLNGGKIPMLGGTGDFRIRVSTRSKFYEIQAEVKIKNFNPPSSKFSALGGTSKINPFFKLGTKAVNGPGLDISSGAPKKFDIRAGMDRRFSMVGPRGGGEIEVISAAGMVRKVVSSLLLEELTGADKSDIKRMIAKEIDGAANRKATRKIFLAEFDREFKKMIDSKPLKDSIRSEVESTFKNKATKKEIAEVTKAVIKKLYRELSYSSVHIVDRIKI